MGQGDEELAATERIAASGWVSATVESARGRYRTLVRHEGGAVPRACACSCPAHVACRHARFLWSEWQRAPRTFLDLKEVDAALAALREEELRGVVARALRLRPELARAVNVLAQGVLSWERAAAEAAPPPAARHAEAAP